MHAMQTHLIADTECKVTDQWNTRAFGASLKWPLGELQLLLLCVGWLVGRLGLQVRNIDVAKTNYLPAVKASILDTSIISHCITASLIYLLEHKSWYKLKLKVNLVQSKSWHAERESVSSAGFFQHLFYRTRHANSLCSLFKMFLIQFFLIA